MNPGNFAALIMCAFQVLVRFPSKNKNVSNIICVSRAVRGHLVDIF